jgi:hypothetical protein
MVHVNTSIAGANFSPFLYVDMGYELERPENLSLNGKDIFNFSKISRLDLGPTQPPMQWVPGFFPQG